MIETQILGEKEIRREQRKIKNRGKIEERKKGGERERMLSMKKKKAALTRNTVTTFKRGNIKRKILQHKFNRSLDGNDRRFLDFWLGQLKSSGYNKYQNVCLAI